MILSSFRSGKLSVAHKWAYHKTETRGYKYFVPTARSQHAFATIAGSVLAQPEAAFPNQTLPDSAASKSVHTFARRHPSRDSSSAKPKSFDRSEPKRCPANTADFQPAIARDKLLSRSKALRPSRAGCCKLRRCNSAAFSLSSGRPDSDTRPNTGR